MTHPLAWPVLPPHTCRALHLKEKGGAKAMADIMFLVAWDLIGEKPIIHVLSKVIKHEKLPVTGAKRQGVEKTGGKTG